MIASRSRLGFRKWTAALFDQQLWCFGRDIKRAEGNILLDLGMCVYRPPDPDCGSSVYTAAVEPGGSVFLWGFGAMYSEPGLGGIFLRRYDFAPRLTPLESGLGIHEPKALGRLVAPSTSDDDAKVRALLPGLIGWFAKYEHWIAESFGIAYRESCLICRNAAAAVPAGSMAVEWERAAKKSRRIDFAETASHNPWRRLIAKIRPFRLPAKSKPSNRVIS